MPFKLVDAVLAETGTRGLLGAVFGSPATGETNYARQLFLNIQLFGRDWVRTPG